MQPNNHLSINSQYNNRIQPYSELEVDQQERSNQGNMGLAIVRILNNSAEFCKSLLPFYGAAPSDGEGRIQLQVFDTNQFFQEIIQFVPRLVGDASTIVRVMQLLMMAGASHATSEHGCNRVRCISTAKQLNTMTGSAETFHLTQDINATYGTGNIKNFTGSLDGRGHTIRGLKNCLFNKLKGKVSNLNIEGAGIFQQSTRSQTNIAAGAIADVLDGGTISNVNISSSSITANADTVFEGTPEGETGSEAYAGSVVGRNLHDGSLQNVTAKNNTVSAKASSTANAGGILGANKNGNGTLVAKHLDVSNSSISASSRITAIASGAIGDVANGCNQAGSVSQTCNDIRVSNTRITASNPSNTATKSDLPSVAAGVLSGNQNSKAGSNFSVANNSLHATCEYNIVGSFDNCIQTTPSPSTYVSTAHHTFSSTAHPKRTTHSVARAVPTSIKAAFFNLIMGGFAVGAVGFVVGSYIKAYREGKSGWDLAKAPYYLLGEVSGYDLQERHEYRKRRQLTDVIETDSEEEDLILDVEQIPNDVSLLFTENDEERLQSNRTPVLSFTTPASDRRVMVEIHRQNSDLDSQIDTDDEVH